MVGVVSFEFVGGGFVEMFGCCLVGFDFGYCNVFDGVLLLIRVVVLLYFLFVFLFVCKFGIFIGNQVGFVVVEKCEIV